MGNDLYKLRSFGYVEIDDEIWFPNLNFNALMKINKSTGRLEIVDKFPNYGAWQGWLYSTVCYVDGYLVFVPNCSEEIVAYNLKSQKFISTALDNEFIGQKKTYFINGYVHEHYVYMLPTGAECIVRYNSNNHTIQYLENELSALIRTKPETFYCFYQQFEVIDQKIYIPFLELNAVVIFGLAEESIEIKYLDIKGGCSTINYVDGLFYLASWKSPEIYCWNEETGKIKTYREFPENFMGTQMFLCGCDVGDRIVLFPEQSNMIISFSITSGEIYEVQEIHNFNNDPVMTYFVSNTETGQYLLTADMDAIGSYIYTTNRLEIRPCHSTDKLYNKKQIDNFFFHEDEKVLEEYIAEVLKNSEGTIQTEEQCNYGKRIFDQIRLS
ncbi:MAG: hypothetical protein HFE75_03805 [Firmicutes bacterium]|jgi:hypothetical protein|nr:hypothetical protein [Bacillota bacterium]NBI62546.1 hypothetical protein [Clostridiales bacterium]